jgi:GST-like protein
MDRRLGEAEYLAGEYSVADIASFPWIRPYRRQGQDLEDYPNLKRWFDAIDNRPAVQRGLQVPSGARSVSADMDETTRSILFGAAQYAKH